MTLVILAAGMGSRYGGLKQMDPMNKNGEFIIDFSVFDAIRAGFDRAIFIIREEFYDDFRNTIGKRAEKHIKVEYAFQRLDDIPKGYTVPEGRTKPWGTTQAILSVKDLARDDFVTVNADDFYGRDAFIRAAEFLKNNKNDNEYCVIGYKLKNTLSDAGTVSRGVCETDSDNRLLQINERTKIRKEENGGSYLDENGKWIHLDGDTPVSMNCWCLKASAIENFEKSFKDFFARGGGNELKSECYLPMSIDEMMKEGKVKVAVVQTQAKWFGVTYPEDKDSVVESIQKLIECGEYPESLWN